MTNEPTGIPDVPLPPTLGGGNGRSRGGDGRVNNGGNRGGGAPKGASRALGAPTEVVLDAMVELRLGESVPGVAEKFALEPGQVRRIQSLVDLTPQVFFERLGNRFEGILDKASIKLEQAIDRNEGDVKTLSILLGVMTDKLGMIRGSARPQVMNQTININGMSAADARKFLLTGEVPAGAVSDKPKTP